MKSEQIQVLESQSIEVIEAQQRAEYDIQITTAKKFPRNLNTVKENCIAIVSMDKEIAASCRYALPRGGKTIAGPSVHLARIIAQQYGNIRVDARVKNITDKQIISEAVCFDLETNYACKVEVRRSIVGRSGRFNDDMITVTGNAANAISFRNAVLNVVPKGITDAVYKSSMKQLTGDLSNEQDLIVARKKALDYFNNEHEINESQVLKVMGLRSSKQIKKEQIADLRAMVQSITDGDSTIDEMFNLKVITKDDKTPAPDALEFEKDQQKTKTENNEQVDTTTGELFQSNK